MSDLEELLDGGDPQRGKEVFVGRKAACAACHRIGSDGGNVGPDLSKIGSVRAGQDILESIVFPSVSIAQGYECYLVVTINGLSATGIVAETSQDTVLLREQSGVLRRIVLSELETMDRLSTSLMPEGLSKAMTRGQLRELLAFLQTLK